MFEVVVPLHDVSFAHGIITNGLLKLLEDLSLSITKLLEKLDAISLLNAFRHLEWKQKSEMCTLHICILDKTVGN